MQFSSAAAGLLAPRDAPLRRSSPFSLPPSSARSFTLSLLTPSPRPLSLFCLIASAPPYNHAGSRLSFGVVYIAVIVRAQCGDWAEHVYSFTGQRRHKSARGEEKGFPRSRRGGVVWCAQALARARSHFHWRAAALKQHGETEKKKKPLLRVIVFICQQARFVSACESLHLTAY